MSEHVEAKAPCVGAGDIFFGPEPDLREEEEVSRKVREARCRQVCSGCFMRIECLSFALANKEVFGVWGGMSSGDRREFVVAIKRHRKSNWKEAIYDLDYLERKSTAFLWKKEEKGAERHRSA